MSSIKSHIPNSITCLNLFFGCLACVAAFEHNYARAAFCIYLSAVWDFFDGFAARLLKVQSPIGKDLDSLADCVSFGVAPGMILFAWLQDVTLPEFVSDSLQKTLAFGGFAVTVFAALRLAKFNNDTRQSTSFVGLPTPAMTIFFASLAATQPHFFTEHGFLLMTLIAFFAYLMVAEFPMFALKFKHFGWKGNELRYSFVAGSALLLLGLGLMKIYLVILLYIVVSAVALIVAQRGKKSQG